jgi:hypothetical protein
MDCAFPSSFFADLESRMPDLDRSRRGHHVLITFHELIREFVLQMYLFTNELADRGKKHMEKKNMHFTQEGGLKVGVKEVSNEAYADKTQTYAAYYPLKRRKNACILMPLQLPRQGME